MTIPGGYILQPRKIDESDIMREPPVTRELWFYLLRRVNHKDKEKFKRGSAFFNLGDIQEALHWYVGYRKQKYSKPQLTKSLRRLRERNMIATVKATRGVFVTILNYDHYQNPKNYEGNDEDQMKETRRKQSGITKNKNDKNERKKKEYTVSFLKFWEAYPNKKCGKATAFRAWAKQNGNRPGIDTLLEIIEQHKQSEQWQRDGGQYIPMASTWLNQERWTAEMEVKNSTASDQEPF